MLEQKDNVTMIIYCVEILDTSKKEYYPASVGYIYEKLAFVRMKQLKDLLGPLEDCLKMRVTKYQRLD